jgi:thiamine monophosphate kinase
MEAIREVAARMGTAVTAIGRVRAGEGVVLLDEASREILAARKGYTHF